MYLFLCIYFNMNKLLPKAFKYIAFEVGPANLMRVETKELQVFYFIYLDYSSR